MSKKKEYENVFSKMIEVHNNEVVPFIKQFQRYGALKISRQRCLLKRDKIEESDGKYIDTEHFTEYLLLNKFIFDLLDKETKTLCTDLFKSNNKDNIIISASIVYNLIESKKTELIENNNKLNEKL